MVLNICSHDHANFMYDMTEAMKSVGIECMAVKRFEHDFKYQKECPVWSSDMIRDVVAKADIVQIFHSDTASLKLAGNKPKIVYHTGTAYRQKPVELNAIFVKCKPVVALGEFMALASKNTTYIVGAIDSDKYKMLRAKAKFRFGHFPSNPKVKGTEDVKRLLNGIAVINEVKCSHAEYIKRLQSVDVVVEMFSPFQFNKPYGSWGITCLEAAAIGRVVLTQNISKNVYESNYGSSPILLANTESEFKEHVNRLKSISREELNLMQKDHKNWVEEKHSYKATGEYIKKHILNG